MSLVSWQPGRRWRLPPDCRAILHMSVELAVLFAAGGVFLKLIGAA